jgi:hypothetical protein
MGQSESMKYEDLAPITRADFDAACLTGGSEQATAILRLALHDDDPSFVEQACSRLLDADDSSVRRAAIVAIGHLARLHGHVGIETQSRIRALIADPGLAGAAADALDDIAMFGNA